MNIYSITIFLCYALRRRIQNWRFCSLCCFEFDIFDVAPFILIQFDFTNAHVDNYNAIGAVFDPLGWAFFQYLKPTHHDKFIAGERTTNAGMKCNHFAVQQTSPRSSFQLNTKKLIPEERFEFCFASRTLKCLNWTVTNEAVKKFYASLCWLQHVAIKFCIISSLFEIYFPFCTWKIKAFF